MHRNVHYLSIYQSPAHSCFDRYGNSNWDGGLRKWFKLCVIIITLIIMVPGSNSFLFEEQLDNWNGRLSKVASQMFRCHNRYLAWNQNSLSVSWQVLETDFVVTFLVWTRKYVFILNKIICFRRQHRLSRSYQRRPSVLSVEQIFSSVEISILQS